MTTSNEKGGIETDTAWKYQLIKNYEMKKNNIICITYVTTTSLLDKKYIN